MTALFPDCVAKVPKRLAANFPLRDEPTIADRYVLKRATEVAGELSWGPLPTPDYLRSQQPHDVRVGSIASFWPCASHFRFTPEERTSSDRPGMSGWCQQATSRVHSSGQFSG